MLRKSISWAFSLSLLAPALALGDPMREAVSQLPADAMAVLCIPSLKQLDTDYQQAISDLGLKDMVQPPANSLLGLVKGSLPIFAQMDETRPMAVVVMPSASPMEMAQNAAILVPVGNPKAVVEGMGATAGEGGIYAGSMMGQPTFFALGEKRLIVAQSEAVAKAVSAKATGLDKTMKPEEVKGLDNLDLLIWINADKTMQTLKPMIEGFLPMMLMSMQSSPSGAKQAEATKKQIDVLVDGMASLSIGVALSKDGTNLRMGFTSKSGSELAAQTKLKPTSETLLSGLPGDRFLATFGQVMDPEQTQANMKSIDPYLDMLDDVESLDKEKVGQLKSAVKEVLPMLTGMRGVVQMMPGGSSGLIGFAILVDARDSARLIEVKTKAFETAKSLIATTNDPAIDEEAKKMVAALTYTPAAEEISGAKVGHLKFDLSQVPDMDDEERAQMEKVIGKDGLLVRSAAVDGQTIAMTFGGGTDYMAKILETAKKKEAPLDKLPGIVKVSEQLPKERASVVYVAIDQVLETIDKIMQETGEEALPVKMPALQSPIAVSSTGGSEWSRMDLVVPMEVMKASKDAVMTMMSGGGEDEGDEGAAPEEAEEGTPPGGE